MIPKQNMLTVFVAMPYSDFGPNAKRSDPKEVEDFYRTTANRIELATGRTVNLEIERYRGKSGIVHQSMFTAIYNADVLIADLTGANGNVLFELGIRHSVRPSITILTTQDARLPFDLAHMRAIKYANRDDELAHAEIAAFVKNGLEQPDHCDSPVLEQLQLRVVPRSSWERVAGIRVENLLDKANKTDDSAERLTLIRQAVEDDPHSMKARLAFTKALRDYQDYGSALEAVETGIADFPNNAELYKEKAIILDRMSTLDDDRFEDAAEAFRKALQIAPRDPDINSAFGGSLRRRAMHQRSQQREELLAASFELYSEANNIQRHDTYSGLNLLRLLMLMSTRPDLEVQQHLTRMFHLCAFEVTDAEMQVVQTSGDARETSTVDQRCWKLFDYGDTLILRNETNEGMNAYKQALLLIPTASQDETLRSPRSTWKELLDSGSLPAKTRQGAEDLLSFLDIAHTD